MNHLESLIEKFWKETISEKELSELNELVSKEHTAFRELLQQRFDNSIRKSDQVLEGHALDKNPSKPAKRSVISMRYKWVSIAALFILIAGIGWWKFANEKAAENKDRAIANAKSIEEIKNNSDTLLNIELPDKSIVTLFSQSSIQYCQSTFPQKRNIDLTGKAGFKVKADKTHPFTVVANKIATTAIGTEFIVSEKEEKVKVALLSGKVVISSASKGFDFKEVYLEPGETFDADMGINSFKVQTKDKQPKPEKNINKPKPVISKDSKAEYDLVFVNERLSKVFHKMSQKYHIRIDYDPTEIKDIFFTGIILTTDKISDVLTIISKMNNLEIETNERGIVVRKKH